MFHESSSTTHIEAQSDTGFRFKGATRLNKGLFSLDALEAYFKMTLPVRANSLAVAFPSYPLA